MSDLPFPLMTLVGRAHTEPVARLIEELGSFVLVGETEDDDPGSWTFATTSMVRPFLGDDALGFDFERGIVHPVKKQRSTFVDTVLLGRSPSNDICVDHPSVSKLHARIRLEADRFEIEDAGSRNGTWHEDARADSPVKVYEGDTLRFGSRRFIVHVTTRLIDLLKRVDAE